MLMRIATADILAGGISRIRPLGVRNWNDDRMETSVFPGERDFLYVPGIGVL